MSVFANSVMRILLLTHSDIPDSAGDLRRKLTFRGHV